MKPITQFLLTAGRYYVGDPSKVFEEYDWRDVCKAMFRNGTHGIVTTRDDGTFFFCYTANGNGFYALKESGKDILWLPVESGCLSVIPMHLAIRWSVKANPNNPDYFGLTINVTEDTMIECTGDGNFTFGKYSVKTD